MSDQSGEQFMKKCCPLFLLYLLDRGISLDRQTTKVEEFFQWRLAFKYHNTSDKTTETNQKTHANQLIPDKLCGLPANIYIKCNT